MKMEEYFSKMRNFDLEVLEGQSGFDDIPGVMKAPTSKQERRDVELIMSKMK